MKHGAASSTRLCHRNNSRKSASTCNSNGHWVATHSRPWSKRRRVALADARLDKHEELMVRRVADLLFVPHSEFIRRKHLAQAAQADRSTR